jgi:1-acyl-sn-glycerol-3-phosphate acyltransferase
MADTVVASSASQPGAGLRRRFGLWTLLMNAVVYPLLVLWTVLGMALFPVGLLAWKVAAGWPLGRIMRHFIWIYGRGWLLIMAPFVRFRRRGFAALDLSQPVIFVVNHQSFFDTYCMGLLPAFDVTFAVRAWPFRMIWYGWFMRLAGYLDVETSTWAQIEAAGRGVLEKGGHLLFFPEGHRSRDGRLQRFYNGAFQVAMASGRPIVPLCLQGTGLLLAPGRLALRPATVTLTALEPVDSSAFQGENAHRALRNAVRERMAAALVASDREGRG